MIDRGCKIRKMMHTSYRVVQDKFVIINLKNDGIYVFNIGMKKLWREIEKETTVDKIIEKFEVESVEDINEIEDMLEKLFATKLIKIGDRKISSEKPIKNQRDAYRNDCDKNNNLFEVMFEITETCNLYCEHCYMEKKKNHMNREDINKILKQLKHAGAIDIMFTGGEIFTREDTLDIIRDAIDNGFVVSLLTNATLLDDKVIDSLSELGIASLTTSMYGIRRDTHDDITKVKGSFKNTFENIKKVKAKGISCRVNYVLMNSNVNEVEEFVQAMSDLKLDYYIESNIVPTREGNSNTSDMRISSKKYKELLKKGILEMPFDFTCKSGSNRIRIDADGEVFPCEYIQFSFGNLKTDKIDDIWNGEDIYGLRQATKNYLPKECSKCDFKKNCGRCPAFIWQKNRYDNRKSDDMCIKAMAATELKKEESYIVPGDGVISREYEKYLLVISGKKDKKVLLDNGMAVIWKEISKGIKRKDINYIWKSNMKEESNIQIEEYLKKMKEFDFIKESNMPANKEVPNIEKSMDKIINKVGIVLTDKCNFKCPHCYNGDNRNIEESMTLRMWKETLISLKNYGCFNVMITGGEPFTSKILFQLLDFIEANDFLFEINTNGSLIDNNIIKKLSGYKSLTKVNFTMYGTRMESYEKFTKFKMSPKHIVNCVKSLKENNIRSYVQFNFTKDKFEDIKNIEKFEKDNEIEIEREYSFIHGRIDKGMMKDYNLTEEQMVSLVESGIISIKKGLNPCKQCGGNRASINPRGDVTQCEMSASEIFGNLCEKSFEEIWESNRTKEYFNDKNLDAQCSKCDTKEFCSRCDGISIVEMGSKNKIPQRLCEYSRMLKDIYNKTNK